MNINITDHLIGQFLSGVLTIFVLVGVGGVLSVFFSAMSKRFAFTRLALILALTPLCLVQFLDRSSTATLYLFSMIAVLLGITIDGINYLLIPKEQPRAIPKAKKENTAEEEAVNPDVIVWEKAEQF